MWWCNVPCEPVVMRNEEDQVAALPLAVNELSFAYVTPSGSLPVLDRVSLAVGEGEMVAIMGPSGSGKSTLLLCAAGLLQTFDGEVLLNGVNVGDATDAELTRLRRGAVGFIFQDYNLVPALTNLDNVGLPARFAGQRIPQRDLFSALAQVGLADKAGSRPDSLSGGQRQRVAIARALVSRPRVVFADEPTGALDSRSGAQVLDQFEQLAANGSAILVVTHDPTVAARADRVVFLRDGRLAGATAARNAADIARALTELEELAA